MAKKHRDTSNLASARREMRGAKTCKDKKAAAMLVVDAVRERIRATPGIKAKAKKALQREGLRAGKLARGYCGTLMKQLEKSREQTKKLEMRALGGRRRRR